MIKGIRHFMNNKFSISFVTAIIFSLWAPMSMAEAVIASKLQVQSVTEVSHQEVLKNVSSVKPGDLLQYSVVYSNSGTSGVSHLLGTLPIPEGTTLELDHLSTGAFASTDGKSFKPLPLMHSVVGKDGVTREEKVPLSDIRVLRWDLDSLNPQQNKTVMARVRVITPENLSQKGSNKSNMKEHSMKMLK